MGCCIGIERANWGKYIKVLYVDPNLASYWDFDDRNIRWFIYPTVWF